MYTGLTKAGEIYLANRLANKLPVNFLKVKIGNGTVPHGADASETTELYSFKKEIQILDITQTDNVARIRVLIDNSDVEQGFFMKELGVYVDDNGKEKLYWYVYEDNGQYVHSKTERAIQFDLELVMEVTSSNSTILDWNKDKVWISKNYFDEKVRTFEIPTIAELQSRKNLKVGDIVEVLGYYEAGDGAGHKRIIANEDDGSGVQLANGLWANIVHNGEVNVSWFGAKGDGVTDDTQTIQKAMNYKANIFAQGNFLINNTVEINNRNHLNINFENTTFKYTGTSYAFKLYKITYCTFKFGGIYSDNGGGLELYSDCDIYGDDSNYIYNYIQYLNIYFNEFVVKNTCFNFNFNGSWLNEIRFYNGQVKGNIGFFADSKNKDGVNGIKLHNIGFEGVGTGVWLKDGCGCWSILMPRYAESIDPLLIKTEGHVSGLIFIGQNWLYKHYLSLSSETSGKINSPIIGKHGGLQSYEAIISSGVIHEINQADGYANLYLTHNIDLSIKDNYDGKQPKYFLVGDSNNVAVTDTIKLSDKYGCDFGVNEFHLQTQYFIKESNIKIIDSKGQTIFYKNNFSGVEQFKFYWKSGVDVVGKWYCEKINLVESTNISSISNETISQLNTFHIGEKIKQEGVYNDFMLYMDEKAAYDKRQKEIKKQIMLSYQEALKENPNLTYEEFLSMQPMTLNLITSEEPQPSEALKKFMEKYL